MAHLPVYRVCPDEPPFTRVRVDLLGQIETKSGRSVLKRYGVIFSCLYVRAVHLEVASSIDTDSCISTIRKFVAHWGPIKIMASDNGTNLMAAEAELKREIQSLDQDILAAAFQCKNTDGHFNPPSASHFEDVRERLIRSDRKVMFSELKEQVIRLDDEVLRALFCDVEAILNRRPIRTISDDHKERETLTPNHLLSLHPVQEIPVGTFDKKWCKRWRIIEVDDLGLVLQNSPRNKWPLARVTEVIKDQKGLVRCVTVRTRGSTYLQKSVEKLVLLMEGDLRLFCPGISLSHTD